MEYKKIIEKYEKLRSEREGRAAAFLSDRRPYLIQQTHCVDRHAIRQR